MTRRLSDQLHHPHQRMADLGTTGLIAWVRDARPGRQANGRRIAAERELCRRYPISSARVLARFRNALLKEIK